MSQHYYADGAKHIDNHKEININLGGGLAEAEGAIAQLANDFFKDDDMGEASFEEVKDDNVPADDITNHDAVSLAQSNIIFNTKMLLIEEHYVRLHDVTLAFIKVDEDTTDVEYRIDATAQNEWYYIMKGIKEAQVVSRSGFTLTKFVEQMVAWYPDLFILKDGEDKDKMVRRYMSSVSREGKKWIAGIEKRDVLIKDMFAHGNTMGYDQSWTLRVHGVADGLKKALVALKEEMEKEKAKH